MAVPVAPAAGEPIAEAWGDVVHEQVVAQDIQSGAATVQCNAATAATLIVVFPRPFAAIPKVVATVNIGTTFWICMITSKTATQMSIQVTRKDGATATATVICDWMAIGPRA
jgi:hypothetical protein